MTVRLAIPMMSNVLLNVEVMVTPDLALIVTPCISHHFFDTSEAAAPISKQSVPEVKSLVPVIIKTVTAIFS